MVDLHNRVEARPGLVGSGMSADPEKISEVQNQWEQGVRTYGQKRKNSFKQVIRNNKAASLEKNNLENKLENKLDNQSTHQVNNKAQDIKIQPAMHWVRV